MKYLGIRQLDWSSLGLGVLALTSFGLLFSQSPARGQNATARISEAQEVPATPSKTTIHPESDSLPGYEGSFTSRVLHAALGFDPFLVSTSYAEAANRSDFKYTSNQELTALAPIEARRGVTSQAVCGADNRKQILNTTDIPWRWNCQLIITLSNGQKTVGSGWLAGPRLVVTAGHCLHSGGTSGTWVQSVEVIPGMNGSSRPYGTFVSTNFRVADLWLTQKNANYDYGAIILDNAIGDRLGYYAIASLTDTVLRTMTFNSAGYPSDKTTGTQWFASGPSSKLEKFRILHSIDNSAGQDGSPLYQLLNEERTVVGIQALSGCPGAATRVTAEAVTNIGNWRTIKSYPTTLTNGLVAYYPFNGNANDESGRANHATPINGASLDFDRHGNANSSYKFDGIDDFLVAPHQSYLTLETGDFTISLWAKLTASTDCALISKDQGNPYPKWVWFHANNYYGYSNQILFHYVPPSHFWLCGTDYQVDNGWHHLLIQKKGTRFTTYVDGNLAASDSESFVLPAGNTSPLEIGRAESSFYLTGSIDQVRIYDRALTDTEIVGLYELERDQ